jgi:hypothetical protein
VPEQYLHGSQIARLLVVKRSLGPPKRVGAVILFSKSDTAALRVSGELL